MGLNERVLFLHSETPAKALAAPLRQRSNKRSQSMNPPPPFSPPPLA